MAEIPRILLLCNSPWAIPAVDELAGSGHLAGVGILRREKNTIRQVAFAIPAIRDKLFSLDKKTWIDQIRKKILELKPHVVFVVTFPFRIPQELLALPELGFINFHFGALPMYAGNNPVFWQIYKREPYAAVSVHRMDEDIDTGPLYMEETVPILPRDTFGMVCLKLSFLTAELVREMAIRLERHGALLKSYPQKEGRHLYPRNAAKLDATIQWQTEDAAVITALVNATNPWNMGAISYLKNLAVRILEVAEIPHSRFHGSAAASPGTILAISEEEGLLVLCRDGKILRVDIIHTDIGFISGKQLSVLGVSVGDCFQDSRYSG